MTAVMERPRLAAVAAASAHKVLTPEQVVHASLFGHARVAAIAAGADAWQVKLAVGWAAVWSRAHALSRLRHVTDGRRVRCALDVLSNVARRAEAAGPLAPAARFSDVQLAALADAALEIDELAGKVPVASIVQARAFVQVCLGAMPLGFDPVADAVYWQEWLNGRGKPIASDAPAAGVGPTSVG